MFLLRQQAELMRQHTQVIADSLVHLLKTCPDAVTARKELLVATRHMMSTNFRDVFRSKLDDVLDARVFVGSGRACTESLRPLGYTILAELVHHTRKTLTPHQLSKVGVALSSYSLHYELLLLNSDTQLPPVSAGSSPSRTCVQRFETCLFPQAVYTFTTITFDATLPVAVHTTCIRLLLNLVECIYPLARSTSADAGAKIKGRQLLSRILECLVTKVKHLKLQVRSSEGCVDVHVGACWDDCRRACLLLKLMPVYLLLKCCLRAAVCILIFSLLPLTADVPFTGYMAALL